MSSPESTPTVAPPTKRLGLVALIASLPTLVRDLIKAEIDVLKAEYTAKAQVLAVGIGAFVLAAILVILLLASLLAWAMIALASVLPIWAAGLIVVGSLIILILIAVIVGRVSLKNTKSLTPDATLAGLQEDLTVVKGTWRQKA